MNPSLGFLKGISLEVFVLYVQVWVCSESVVQSNSSNSKLAYLKIHS